MNDHNNNESTFDIAIQIAIIVLIIMKTTIMIVNQQ